MSWVIRMRTFVIQKGEELLNSAKQETSGMKRLGGQIPQVETVARRLERPVWKESARGGEWNEGTWKDFS